jgi:hypothetical protein
MTYHTALLFNIYVFRKNTPTEKKLHYNKTCRLVVGEKRVACNASAETLTMISEVNGVQILSISKSTAQIH